jgi:hypothetical protein
MSDSIINGAQGVVSTLKGAQSVGKDLGKIVGQSQSDIESTVNEQHRQRLEAKAREQALKQVAEFRAFNEFEKEMTHKRELLELKKKAIAKYGPKSWDQIEQIKNKLEKERLAEEKLISNDRKKVQDVFWWCLTASALVTYFFKLYK